MSQSSAALNRVMDHWKLKIPFPDVLEKNNDEDIIEIVGREGQLLYRSFEFYQFCSYSLADLMEREFFELYDRPLEISQQLHETFQAVFHKKDVKPVRLHIPVHLITEIATVERRQYWVTYKWLTPVLNSENEICAVAVTYSLKPHSAGPVLSSVAEENLFEKIFTRIGYDD